MMEAASHILYFISLTPSLLLKKPEQMPADQAQAVSQPFLLWICTQKAPLPSSQRGLGQSMTR